MEIKKAQINGKSVADLIMDYKKLLDADVITQDEFETKKKMLLNI